MNPDLGMFQRKFTAEVRRCDEMERKVNYIKKELIKDGMDVPDLWNDLPRVANPREFIDLEAQFEKTENEILELSENFAQLLQNFQELTELRYVLERTQVSCTWRRCDKRRLIYRFPSRRSSQAPATWTVERATMRLPKVNSSALSPASSVANECSASSECCGACRAEMCSCDRLTSRSRSQILRR